MAARDLTVGMASPLRRFPRELKNNLGKYLAASSIPAARW